MNRPGFLLRVAEAVEQRARAALAALPTKNGGDT